MAAGGDSATASQPAPDLGELPLDEGCYYGAMKCGTYHVLEDGSRVGVYDLDVRDMTHYLCHIHI